MTIAANNVVTLTATVTVSANVPVYLALAKRVIACFRHVVCHTQPNYLEGTFTVTGNFAFSIDASGNIVIDVTSQLDLVGDPIFRGCHIPSWVGWFANVKETIRSKVQESLQVAAGKLTQHITVPKSFEVIDGGFINYKADSFLFVPDEYIVFKANTTIIAESNGVNETMVVPTDEANLNIPTAWNETSPTNPDLKLIVASRINALSIEAIPWEARETGALNLTSEQSNL